MYEELLHEVEVLKNILVTIANGGVSNKYSNRVTPIHSTSNYQVLTPIYDPSFSEHSYGFYTKIRGHDAVSVAKGYTKEVFNCVAEKRLLNLSYVSFSILKH
ncbi:hypothetical protein [Gottfriedia acidiceleris]|uniref:Uncharacterized protein n=1 Tax=Gottfriedia acidiceleris TaxID=371036 RepID=A0ABY4JQK3_9BACI|nr:hypothetical protein [Gottfriedia acidiceleris]UPM56111.1 hypothetical protein MY490_09865 [Gottfriedia acidiceleris]